MRCLGITGGIGSGKSYVSRVFTALGIPVYEADSQTKMLYVCDNKLKLGLTALLGEEIYREGVLQKEVMATKIFSDQNLLSEVNRLVHPAVVLDFSAWKMQQRAPYVILESAIILETPFAFAVDRMLTVSSPIALRMERLYRRDTTSAADAQQRMERQWNDAMREAKADFVVHSDGRSPLLPQVLEVHRVMSALEAVS